MTQENTIIPLTLSLLKFSAYDVASDMACNYPGAALFDGRHDFTVGLFQKGLAVLMVFTNERRLTSASARGIRRTVAISLIDATDRRVMHSTSLRVNIPKNDISRCYRVDLPFAYADIRLEHTYTVTVRDGRSGRLLGEGALHMFDENLCERQISAWFNVVSGGVCPDGTDLMFTSYEGEFMTYSRVRFNIDPDFTDAPDILPELEIRVYYPDGKVDSRFCRLECDDYDLNDYHVEMPFLMDMSRQGICYAELICMDYALAGFVFNTDGQSRMGTWSGKDVECLDEYSLPAATARYRAATEPAAVEPEEEDEFETALRNFIATDDGGDEADGPAPSAACEAPEEPAQEPAGESRMPMTASLANLTGLKAVKQKLTAYEMLVRFNKMRRDNDLPTSTLPLHAMFLGSPGTGKTTVAKMIGLMLAKAGVLSRGHVIVRERSTLLGPNYSMEETNTLKAIDEAQGGILLIDEAYQLCQPGDPRDPGKFVIETLLTALADESRRDWMLILAGYPDGMRGMFDLNPGLASRIPESNIYVFEDFSESELMEIAEKYLERNGYTLSPAARNALSARLADDCSRRDKTFGNARHVINLIQTEILPAMAMRVVSADIGGHDALTQIQAADIPAPAGIIRPGRPRIGYGA